MLLHAAGMKPELQYDLRDLGHNTAQVVFCAQTAELKSTSQCMQSDMLRAEVALLLPYSFLPSKSGGLV